METDEKDELRRREVAAQERSARELGAISSWLFAIQIALLIIALTQCTGKMVR